MHSLGAQKQGEGPLAHCKQEDQKTQKALSGPHGTCARAAGVTLAGLCRAHSQNSRHLGPCRRPHPRECRVCRGWAMVPRARPCMIPVVNMNQVRTACKSEVQATLSKVLGLCNHRGSERKAEVPRGSGAVSPGGLLAGQWHRLSARLRPRATSADLSIATSQSWEPILSVCMREVQKFVERAELLMDPNTLHTKTSSKHHAALPVILRFPPPRGRQAEGG